MAIDLVLVVVFALLGPALSVLLASALFLFKGKRMAFFHATPIPYAIGTLLGAQSGGRLRSLPWELPSILLGITTIVAFHPGNGH